MLKDFADEEKPREKALQQGIGVLTNAELLAILLRVGVRGRNVIDVARDILEKFGNDLGRLASATPRELTQLVPGIGPTKAITVIAALELGQRCRRAAGRERRQMTGSDRIYDYVRHDIEDLDHEEFHALLLNKRLGVIALEQISSGGMDATTVDVRMVIKRALDARAVGMALIHNHPSGALMPSMADDALTRKIKAAAELFDIRLVDHIIVAPTGYYSYNDRGRL